MSSSNSMRQQAKSMSRSESGHATLSDVRDDVSAVKQDLSRLGTDAADYAAGAAISAADTVTQTARQGAELATEKARQAAAYGKHAHEQMCDFVRERPTTSVFLAIGVGALLARVLIPRR